MKTITAVCSNCGKDWVISKADADEDGHIDVPTERCEFCEREFCGRCFRAHECAGHDAEITFCMWCGVDIEIDAKHQPTLIDGDPYCAKCAFEKPWDKKKGA